MLWSRVLESFYRHLLVEQTERIRVETEMRLRGGFFDELVSEQLSGEEVSRRAALLGCDLSDGGTILSFAVPEFERTVRKRKLGSPVDEREDLARHILSRCRERIKNLAVRAGLGEPRENPCQIVRSYQEAESALRIGQNLRTVESLEDRIHTFAALGVQRLLFALHQESPETLRGFEDGVIGIVKAYDREHRTELVETLKTYMDCDGNITEVAGVLHVHKHTVRYRLRRVTELTGLDVAKFEDAARLYLAVRAGELP